MREILDSHFSHPQLKLSDIYAKPVLNPHPDSQCVEDRAKAIMNLGRKNGWSAYDQYNVWVAKSAGVNIKNVFNNSILEKIFKIEGSHKLISVKLDNYEGSVASK